MEKCPSRPTCKGNFVHKMAHVSFLLLKLRRLDANAQWPTAIGFERLYLEPALASCKESRDALTDLPDLTFQVYFLLVLLEGF